MRKMVIALICLCLFLAVSCSKGDNTAVEKSASGYRYTLVTHDGTVFKNMTDLTYGTGAVVRGYLPDGTKIWAGGNWYVIREK